MQPIFGLVFSGEHLTIGALAIVVAVLLALKAVDVFWKVDTKRLEAQRTCATLNTWLTAVGLPVVATIFEALSVGDLVDAQKHFDALLDILKDPVKRTAALSGAFFTQLPEQLGDLQGRTDVLKAVLDWATANPDPIKAAGYTIALLPK